MDTASNVKKDKIVRESTAQTREKVTVAASHEPTLPGSIVNSSHMSAKSIVKIATLSRVTEPEENYTVSPSFGMGKHSMSLPTTSFGV